MRFDIIVGNPPYNNDFYIDFLDISHRLSKEYTLMITPAKFYFNDKLKAEKFISLYEYFEKCVFYQCEGEIFNINMASGISYYILGKNKQSQLYVKNISEEFESFNKDWQYIDKNKLTLNIKAIKILDKLGNYNSYKIENNNTNNKYKCNIRKQAYVLGGSSNKARGIFYYDGRFGEGWVTNTIKLQETSPTGVGTLTIFSSDNIEECKSFISYLNTKFVRYLIAIGCSGFSNIMCNDAFRFVPTETEFNHIFNDIELYRKYNLSQEEINTIEEVIKYRNSKDIAIM